MKTYTAYSVVRGVAVTLAFIAIGLPILAVVSAFVIVVGLGVAFFGERSYSDFRETLSYGAHGYWSDVKTILGDFGVFSFHV